MSVSPSGYAEEGAGTSPGAASITPEAVEKTKEDDRLPIHKQDEWQFFLSPYVWIPGINANRQHLEGNHPHRNPLVGGGQHLVFQEPSG